MHPDLIALCRLQDGDMKPFSTYPEDREKLLRLANTVLNSASVSEVEAAAETLADLVQAILSDEATVVAGEAA